MAELGDKLSKEDVCIWKPMMLHQESKYKCDDCIWQDYHCDMYVAPKKQLFQLELQGINYIGNKR